MFLRNPDLGGLPEWETHRTGIKEGVKKYSGRRKPKELPNTTLEKTHTGRQISVCMVVGGWEGIKISV